MINIEALRTAFLPSALGFSALEKQGGSSSGGFPEEINRRAASLLSGFHSVEWNADHLASGVYLYRLETEGFVQTRKMILMR